MKTSAIIIAQKKSVGMKKNAPRVRLEITTYRLTAGRAADCAIQELVLTSLISKCTTLLLGHRVGHDDSLDSKQSRVECR